MGKLPQVIGILAVVLLAAAVGVAGVGTAVAGPGQTGASPGLAEADGTHLGIESAGLAAAQSTPERSNESDDAARLRVTDVTTNAPVLAGETVNVTVEVTNVGETTGEGEVWFRLDSFRKDEATLRLAPGESERVTLQYDSDRDDDALWTLTVATAHHTVTDQFMIEPRRPTFKVTDASVPASVSAGDTLTVTATVENVGDAVGTAPVGMEVDRHPVDETTVRLAPGENVTVTLVYRTTDEFAGDRTVLIYTDHGAAEHPVRIATATPPPTETATPTTESTETEATAASTGPTGFSVPGFGSALAVVALAAAALVVRRGGRTQE